MWKKILILLIVAFLSLNLGMGLKSYAGQGEAKRSSLAAGQLENKVKAALTQVGAGGYGHENIVPAGDMKALIEDISIQACQQAIAQFDDGEKTVVKDRADEFLFALLKGEIIDIGGLPEIEGWN